MFALVFGSHWLYLLEQVFLCSFYVPWDISIKFCINQDITLIMVLRLKGWLTAVFSRLDCVYGVQSNVLMLRLK